jgi:hypothetical protein
MRRSHSTSPAARPAGILQRLTSRSNKANQYSSASSAPLDAPTTTPRALRSSTRSTVPPPPDPAISVELIEVARGEWQLRIVGPLAALGEVGDEGVEVRVKVNPNLVPGVPFTARVTWAKPSPGQK